MLSAQEKRILSRAESSTLSVPVPYGFNYLDFQKVVPEYSLHSKNVLIADEPGLGKTIEMIAIMNLHRAAKVNIFVPTSLVYNWMRELKNWSLNFDGVEIYHPRTFTGKEEILIVSHYWLSFVQTLAHLRKRGGADLQFFDEVHVLKDKKAQITKNTFAKNGYFTLCDRNICASGTPLENTPIEMFHLIRSLAPDVLGEMNRFEYGMRYCGGYQSPWGWDFSGASNLGELGRKLRSSVMVRRTKNQVLKQLPEKVINAAYLEPNNQGLVKRMVLYEELVIRGTIKVDVTEISALRKELGISKIKDALAYIETQIKAGREKIVVFAHHKEVIAGLVEGLAKYNPLEISGRVTRKVRDRAVELFQTIAKYMVIIVSIRAGGVGLTLTAASYAIMVEYDWVPGRNSQCIDRIHRIGQLCSVQADILVYEGTLDERQLKVVLKKEENMKALYDDDEIYEGESA